MHRSIELGRAVLSTSTANFELWLRTLITISPQQQCTNLEQRNATSILDLLSSGEVWVGRGNGLYIDLDLTLRGQPLIDEQLQQLSDAILEAPAWEQLNLKPSLPYDAPHEPGRLRVMVVHSGDLAAKQRHGVLPDTSATDLRPPEGVPVFFLDSVLFCMDVFELVARRNATTAKRLKTSMTSNSLSQSKNSQDVDGPDQEATDALLLDSDSMAPSPSSLSTLKRLRSLASPAKRTASSPITPLNEVFQDSRLASKAYDTQKETPVPHIGVGTTNAQMLIDGALRLSVLGSVNSKLLPGIKIKASTFGPGLADIAPILWKPSYLSSFSRRANLLSTISRSLCQPEATARTTSVSLRQKLSALAVRLPPLQPLVDTQDGEPADAPDRSHLALYVAPQLWLHLQKYTPCKPATSLQSFVNAKPRTTSLPDDILEEAWQGTGKDRRSRPSLVDPNGDGASDANRSLKSCPAAKPACDEILSEMHLLKAVATPESVLEVDDNELLLGDQCCEDAKLGRLLWQ